MKTKSTLLQTWMPFVMRSAPKHTRLLCFVSVWLAHSSVHSADLLSLTKVAGDGGGVRLTWTNVIGHAYLIQTRQRLERDDWLPLLSLTSDSNRALWADEAAPRPSLFYRLVDLGNTNWCSRLQTALGNARTSQGAKGVSAVVIATNGIWQGTSGLSDATNTNGVQPQMRFSIGSITKTFTAALIMQLAEEGKLSVDDPLSTWLPDYPNITNTITIRQLLSHTSGVYNFTENPAYWPMVSETNQIYTPQDTLALVQAPDFLPGQGFHYSNTGFILLGLIAESATHAPVASEIRRRFLDPLELRTVYMEGAEPASGQRAHGFSYNYTNHLEDISARAWWVEYPVAWAAGAMTSTSYEVAQWVGALYGGRVLQPTSIEQMTNCTTLSISSGLPYGLGTMRFSTARGDFWGHRGRITGYAALAAYSPSRKTTVAVLVNQDAVDIDAIWLALVNAL